MHKQIFEYGDSDCDLDMNSSHDDSNHAGISGGLASMHKSKQAIEIDKQALEIGKAS